MLTLSKFLMTLAVIGAIIFAVIFSLATFVEPGSRDTGFTVRADKMIHDSR
ncbi:MAG: histidine kinase [Pseudomonadota bacterium]